MKKVINTQKFLVEMSESQLIELSGEQECIAKYLKTSKFDSTKLKVRFTKHLKAY